MNLMKNKKIYLLLICIFIINLFFFLQENNTIPFKQDNQDYINTISTLSANVQIVDEWSRIWGGSYFDCGCAVALDSLDNIYLAGYTNNFGAGNADMCMVKYNGSGVQQWNRTWGGGSSDRGRAIALDSSDNIYLAGKSESFGVGSTEMCLVKYDGSGVQQWNRTWGGGSSDCGDSIALDSADNIYLTGWTESFGAGDYDIYLVKYDGSGVQQWNRTWGGGSSDLGRAIALDSSDNIYLAGQTESFGAGDYDMCLVKYDGSGVQQWNRTWGGSRQDYGFAIAPDSSDNIYLAGHIYSFGAGEYDMCLVKYDGSGVQQWNRTWGGSRQEFVSAIALDSSDNIYLTGQTESFGAGDYDMCLVKYDSSGVQQWNHIWGGSELDHGSAIALDSSENIYIAGYTYSFGASGADMYLVKLMEVLIKPSDPIILGYDLILLTCIICATSVILIKKRIKLYKYPLYID